MGFHRFSIPFLHSQNSVLIYLAGFCKDKPHGSFYHEQPVITRPHSVTCLNGSKTLLDHIFNVSLISKARNNGKSEIIGSVINKMIPFAQDHRIILACGKELQEWVGIVITKK